MNFEALLAQSVDRHFRGAGPIFRYQVCKNGAYRDADLNRFVSADNVDKNEHSESCDCAACENIRLFGDR